MRRNEEGNARWMAHQTSVGEVWFGLVSALFGQTGNQTISFLTEFLKVYYGDIQSWTIKVCEKK